MPEIRAEMSKRENVSKQYADDKNLSIRASLHAKYNTNPYGYSNWLFDRYEFFSGCRILELGCGTGWVWDGRLQALPAGSLLVLSDMSAHMVKSVWERFADCPGLFAQKVDIQDIPFPDCSFDRIIANHMLYHVPDLPKAVAEVHRVLKPGGVFYATTIGNEGMSGYLHRALKEFNGKVDAFGENTCSFTLQNGTDTLQTCFDGVEVVEYEDSLRITNTQDLVDWIMSTITITGVPAEELTGLYDYFEKIRIAEGAICIPKQVGIFISRK